MTNPDFLGCKEERKNQSFFKVLQHADTSSENTRALPHDFVKSFSQTELSGKIKLRTKWGRRSWKIEISRNQRFYFMEKAGWDKFVRDNSLGDDDFLTFTHKANTCFNVNLYNIDGTEILKPPHSFPFSASSAIGVRTEQVDGFMSSATAETNGNGKNKRRLDLGKKKLTESHNSKMTKNLVRDRAGASSSSVSEFVVVIKKSYLAMLVILRSVRKDHHMPEDRTTFKIHHPDMKKSWNVVYLVNSEGSAFFSGGWRRLAIEYPIAVGDVCKFTFIKPSELLLEVSKARDQTR